MTAADRRPESASASGGGSATAPDGIASTRVQPHGWLLVLDPEAFTVVQASANLEALTGTPAEASLGHTLAEILGAPATAALRRAIAQADSETIGLIDCRVHAPRRRFDAWLSAHWSGEGLIVEVEPAQQEAAAPLLAGLSTAIRRYRLAPDLVALGRVVAADVLRVTGFGRVLVVGFGNDDTPEVLAEDARPEGAEALPRVMVMDEMPVEARVYLELNRLRIVPDMLAPGVPLVPEVNPATGSQPDLSRSNLRAPSRQLLTVGERHGLRAMSIISMINGNRLRGVIIGYSAQPLNPPPAVRALCEALGEIAAGQMAALDERTAAAARMASARALAHLSQNLRTAEDLCEAVAARHWDLITLFGVDGWQITLDGETRMDGDLPPAARWLALLDDPAAQHREGLCWHARGSRQEEPLAVLRLEISAGGALVLVRFESRPWTPAELDAAHELQRVLADRQGELYRARMERRLHRLAYYDPLTDLPNRGFLMQELQRAMSLGEDPSVLVVSLHRFKTLKGSLGDDLANRLLMAVAKRLESCLSPGDRLARIDSGEFAVLLPGIRGPEGAAALSAAIKDVMRTPVSIDRREVFVTANLGLVPSAQAHGLAAEVLRNAEIAAMEAEAGGGGSKAFESAMRARLTERYDLYDRLRQAIYFSGGIHVAYQPIVDLATGELAGFEALARWTHPERGAVPPGEFIPVAEETGLIVPLGNAVLMQACRQIVAWNRRRPDRPLFMSVNLSPYQLDPEKLDLARWAEGVLQLTGADPSWIKLEITESGLVANAATTVDVLKKLRQLGIGLSIDDFGTGYSSLSYLQRLPVQAIKIDQSFMTQLDAGPLAPDALKAGAAPEGAEVVRTIVQLGRTLGFEIVAEGIETHRHLELLRMLGCGLGQGYLFAKPLPPPAAERLVGGERPWSLPKSSAALGAAD